MKRTWPFALLALLFLAIVVRTVPATGRPSPRCPAIASPTPLPADVLENPVAVEPHPEPLSTPEAAPNPTPSRRSAVTEALHWLIRVQNPDGSWGDGPATLGGRPISKMGVTSLALLSLFGGGYSHLSRDGFDQDKPVGPMIRKALDWMMGQQADDGTFPSGFDAGFDHALATLAINEAYGMTGSPKFQSAATHSLEALLRLQGADGSWGGPEPTAWAVRAMASALLNDLPVPDGAREASLRYMLTTPHPANVANRIFLTRDRASIAAEAASLAQAPPLGEGRDFSDWYHAGLGMFQYDGPDGPLWKQWNEPMKNAIQPLQQSDGSWSGGSLSHSVIRAGLAVHTLQVYYRYANVFMTSK